jgi:hypothetical protein
VRVCVCVRGWVCGERGGSLGRDSPQAECASSCQANRTACRQKQRSGPRLHRQYPVHLPQRHHAVGLPVASRQLRARWQRAPRLAVGEAVGPRNARQAACGANSAASQAVSAREQFLGRALMQPGTQIGRRGVADKAASEATKQRSNGGTRRDPHAPPLHSHAPTPSPHPMWRQPGLAPPWTAGSRAWR